jgi:hypothetical protein
MLTALTASLALLAITTPLEPAPTAVRYVGADVLLIRSSPSSKGDLVGRLLINTPVTVMGERDGYAEIALPQPIRQLNGDGDPAANKAWVSAAHLTDQVLTAARARDAFVQAVSTGDDEGALVWAERVVAIEGRRPAALSLLAQAASLNDQEALRERTHEEMEHGRTLVATCGMTGAYLLGELTDDGRFVSAVHAYDDKNLWSEQPLNARKTRMERARLDRLAREVASVRFFDANNGRPLEGSPFAGARVRGLESSVAGEEDDLTYGLKVAMGSCTTPSGPTLYVTRPLKRAYATHDWMMQISPERAARLVMSSAKKANDKVHKDAADVLHGAMVDRLPGEPDGAPPHVVRQTMFTRGGHYEPYGLVRWGLLDGRDEVLLEIDVPGPRYGDAVLSTWFQLGEHRLIFLNWGGENQSGAQLVVLRGDGSVAHHVMPTIVASGC